MYLTYECDCCLLSGHQKVPSLSRGLQFQLLTDHRSLRWYPASSERRLWPTSVPTVLSGRDDCKFWLHRWPAWHHGGHPFLPAGGRRRGQGLHYYDSQEPETLGLEGTSSGSKGGPLNAVQFKEVSINSRFFLAKKGEGCWDFCVKLNLQAPEVSAHIVLLLPPVFRQAAIKALHEDTHAGQQQTVKMARHTSRKTKIWGPVKQDSRSLTFFMLKCAHLIF